MAAGKNKMDAKFFVFGETADPDEQDYFTGRIKSIVRDTLTAILTIAEASYYHHRFNDRSTLDSIPQTYIAKLCLAFLRYKCLNFLHAFYSHTE